MSKPMRPVSKRELEVIAAWWHAGTVVEAAAILGITEQTAKNQLHTARLRTGAPNTLTLARMFAGDLPSLAALRRRSRKAA